MMKTMKMMPETVDRDCRSGFVTDPDFMSLTSEALAKLARLQACRQTLSGSASGPMSLYIDLAEAEGKRRAKVEMEKTSDTIYTDRTTGLVVQSMDETELGIEIPGSAYESSVGKLFFQSGHIDDHGVNGWTNESLIAVVADRISRLNVGEYECQENAMAMTSLAEALEWLGTRSEYRAKIKGESNG